MSDAPDYGLLARGFVQSQLPKAMPRGLASTLWLLGASPAADSADAQSRRHGDDARRLTAKIAGLAAQHATLPPPGALSRHHLTRQVTLTDLLRPGADRAGSLALCLRHPADSAHIATTDAPPGRVPTDLSEAWTRFFEASACGSGRAETGSLRSSLVSFNFLVAACSDAYDARDAAEALRTHVTTNYGGRRVGVRLERFADCLRAMVRCHVFPHQLLRFFGGLVSWVTQDELASVTAVCSGAQEAAETGDMTSPRSTVAVPACAFIDLDAECGLAGAGAAFVYLVFAYRQRLGQEQCRAYVVKSKLPARSLEPVLERLFGRLRITNTIHGTEGADGPHRRQPQADLPLGDLIADPLQPRCSAGQVNHARYNQHLYQWHPDLRGRPTARTCLYAAFSEIGFLPADNPRCTRRSERFGSVDVPMVFLEGVVWRPDEWVECA
ncbi:capsid triplex subunit 1 [Saimiriine alphaherpesvirus 1]|uniref:Capsid triplex subunit 1 n=1 Tax=Saimiriine herpesvirus 1 (strain MV-5-4-PSL) TaxID=10353 RepID=E2IUD1_SHV1|nr:capsid triplex subunit 1 [Saimiriine alphaherpesvirus 1]ADO13789.1 capsid triplex subunit 1 [Saimiriine alphaherpesvirus 1]